MTEPTADVVRTLRGDILAHGLSDWVSLADLRGRLNRRGLATSDPAERQQLMLAVIRSLLVDGLIEVGDIPGPGDPGFLVWPGGVDAVMQKLTDRIVGRWEDPDSWEYATWMNLTAAGQATAEQVQPQG